MEIEPFMFQYGKLSNCLHNPRRISHNAHGMFYLLPMSHLFRSHVAYLYAPVPKAMWFAVSALFHTSSSLGTIESSG